jgi:hypothetical protein
MKVSVWNEIDLPRVSGGCRLQSKACADTRHAALEWRFNREFG